VSIRKCRGEWFTAEGVKSEGNITGEELEKGFV
jgi:hypothetical protein